jgi:hypothetical protein
MDYSKQDEDDLRELIERYRGGFGTSHIVEEISARWQAQGREAFDTIHKARKDIPMPEGMKRAFDVLMSNLRDD